MKFTYRCRSFTLTLWRFQEVTCPRTPAHWMKVRHVRVHPKVKLGVPAIKVHLLQKNRTKTYRNAYRFHAKSANCVAAA